MRTVIWLAIVMTWTFATNYFKVYYADWGFVIAIALALVVAVACDLAEAGQRNKEK